MGAYHVDHLLRLLRAFDGDLMLPVILGEVALFSLRGLKLHAEDCKIDHDTAREFMMRGKACNAHSLSLSLGLPKETVRRKVAKLITLGYLEKDGQRNLRSTPKTFTDFASDFNFESMNKLLGTSDRIRGILSQ